MKKAHLVLLCFLRNISDCGQPRKEIIGLPKAATELAEIFEKTDIASTQQANPTLTLKIGPTATYGGIKILKVAQCQLDFLTV